MYYDYDYAGDRVRRMTETAAKNASQDVKLKECSMYNAQKNPLSIHWMGRRSRGALPQPSSAPSEFRHLEANTVR